MKRRIFAALIAAMMVFAALPVALAAGVIGAPVSSAAPKAAIRTTPEGYNAHDYNAIVTYLEHDSAVDGRKNGEILFPDYDPDDPSTFIMEQGGSDEDGYFFEFQSYDGELCLKTITFRGSGPELDGVFDLSGCDKLNTVIIDNVDVSIDFSGCGLLDIVRITVHGTVSEFFYDFTGCYEIYRIFLDCGRKALHVYGLDSCMFMYAIFISCGSIDPDIDLSWHDVLNDITISVYDADCYACLNASGCSNLNSAYVDGPGIRYMNFSGCSSLTILDGSGSLLTNAGELFCDELNLTGCSSLQQLELSRWHLTELDLSDCPNLAGNHISVSGYGFFSYSSDEASPLFKSFWDDEVIKVTAFTEVAPLTLNFEGWYTAAGALLTAEAELDITDMGDVDLVAVYGGLVPAEGYNANDSIKLLTFLEAPSAVEGKKNGQILNPDYDPADPATYSHDPSYGDSDTYSITWQKTGNGPYRLYSIDIRNKHGLAGTLDLSYCEKLAALSLYDLPNLTALDISRCSGLETLYCCECGVESINSRYCLPTYATCSGNKTASIDFYVHYDIQAVAEEGGGIGMSFDGTARVLTAEPYEGYEFTGWYRSTASDSLITTNTSVSVTYFEYSKYYARFAPIQQPIAGDMDGSGELSFSDIAGLYQVIFNGEGDIDLAVCDVNGDGFLSFADVTALYSKVLGG